MTKAMSLASAAMIGVCSRHPRKRTGRSADCRDHQVDVQKVAAVSGVEVIGSNVANEANETIRKIDDLLVTRDGKEPYAVLSIGGFLGMGTHLVVIPYDNLKFADNKVGLPARQSHGLRCCQRSNTLGNDCPRCTV